MNYNKRESLKDKNMKISTLFIIIAERRLRK